MYFTEEEKKTVPIHHLAEMAYVLNREEASKRLNISVSALKKWMYQQTKPKPENEAKLRNLNFENLR